MVEAISWLIIALVAGAIRQRKEPREKIPPFEGFAEGSSYSCLGYFAHPLLLNPFGRAEHSPAFTYVDVSMRSGMYNIRVNV